MESLAEGDFDHVWVVNPIPNPNFSAHVESWTRCGFTKLRIWALDALGYTKVVYIDADCIVTSNCDSLFDRLDHVSFAAAPDLFPPDNFNAGVMCVVPSHFLFEELVVKAISVDSYDGGDTGFLNSVFGGWYDGKKEGRLPFAYNAQRTMFECTKKRIQYWNSFEKKIVHFSSTPKPWDRIWSDLDSVWVCAKDEMAPSMGKAVIQDVTSILSLESLSFPEIPPFRGFLPKLSSWASEDSIWVKQWQNTYEMSSEWDIPSKAIPQMIHQIWVGGPMPLELNALCREWDMESSARGWKYRLWTDKDISTFQFHQRDFSIESLLPVQIADWFRLEILFQYGGVYIDCDMKMLQFDVLSALCHQFNFFIGSAHTFSTELMNAFIGSTPFHPFTERLLHAIELKDPRKVLSHSGPGKYTETLGALGDIELWREEHAVVLPFDYFYPLPNAMRELNAEEAFLFASKQSVAMHLWKSSWTEDSIEKFIRKGLGDVSNDQKFIEENSRHIFKFLDAFQSVK